MNYLSKYLFFLIISLYLFFYNSYLSAQDSNDINPQWFISKVDTDTYGLSTYQKDSIQNSMMSFYISEYRKVGKDAALDSLATRTQRVLEKYPLKKQKFSTQKKEDFRNEEIKKLQSQKEEIERKIKQLSDKSKPTRVSFLIGKEIENTHRIADSLTIVQRTKKSEFSYLKPIIFDSVSARDFDDLFHYDELSFNSKVDTAFKLPETEFSKNYENFMLEQFFYRRRVAFFAVYQPELIEFYNLESYDSRLADPKIGREQYVYDVDRYISEPSFEKLSKLMEKKETGPWYSQKKLTIHFSQYYVNNWYKGGTPNSTLLSILSYAKNYNKNNLVTWDNKINAEIGFYNTSQDTIRAFRVNNDELDIMSRAGYYTGYKKLYYSLSGYFRSSLFTSYNGINSNEVLTSFLSPSTLTFGLGADYRYNKKTFLQLSPTAYRLIFILDDRVDPISEGIKHGKSASYFGYMLYGELYWKFSREINFTSKANVFCSYPHDYMEMEIELVGNFIINRFLSSRISFKLRTDNKETIETGIQEQLSLGFNYEF